MLGSTRLILLIKPNIKAKLLAFISTFFDSQSLSITVLPKVFSNSSIFCSFSLISSLYFLVETKVFECGGGVLEELLLPCGNAFWKKVVF